MKGGMNIVEKLVAGSLLLLVFGALFLFDASSDTGTASTTEDGTFNYLLNISESYADQGNVTGWMGTTVTLVPIFFIVFFIALIGYAIFK